mmetsp:Transcript_1707/g.2453  ORF Transcript_1707/g.2453 Transcript_1707/m.2453 type:complete len:193 (+) Transcript_1707:188-766(+)|eukprot:CAMPEP_0184863124 /NCGR_PEP_ID=MMETSP0580-20130426/9101_1 /TAXON_ID=1118495 /ORGANISM="Dactyliosolen fragilissimus" /LENGTH=192 /DNA_ID=CAMNT_0027361237 /DNA_START=62 /DNA_END=640 /DNA_ORIENTATION=+
MVNLETQNNAHQMLSRHDENTQESECSLNSLDEVGTSSSSQYGNVVSFDPYTFRSHLPVVPEEPSLAETSRSSDVETTTNAPITSSQKDEIPSSTSPVVSEKYHHDFSDHIKYTYSTSSLDNYEYGDDQLSAFSNTGDYEFRSDHLQSTIPPTRICNCTDEVEFLTQYMTVLFCGLEEAIDCDYLNDPYECT